MDQFWIFLEENLEIFFPAAFLPPPPKNVRNEDAGSPKLRTEGSGVSTWCGPKPRVSSATAWLGPERKNRRDRYDSDHISEFYWSKINEDNRPSLVYALDLAGPQALRRESLLQ
jgi:hypothetical protein